MSPLRCPNAPAPANIFIQLSMGRRAIAGTLPPILDLLLPRRASTLAAPSIRAQNAVHNATAIPRRVPIAPPQRRDFATTSPIRATRTIFNPQHDEDGKEMVLEITPRAGKRLTEIMAKDKNPYLALRIQVESGGCHGFQYLMKLVTLPHQLPTSSAPTSTSTAEDGSGINEDDTIFAFAQDDSSPTQKVDLTAPKIILDGPSLDLLKGSKVDFTMELIGSQFKIVDNPLATSSCGCGTSFDIKI